MAKIHILKRVGGFLSTLLVVLGLLELTNCDELLLTPQIVPFQPESNQIELQQPSIFQPSGGGGGNVFSNNLFNNMDSKIDDKKLNNEEETKGLADDTLEQQLKRTRFYNYQANLAAKQQPSSTQLAVTMALTNNIIPPSPVFSYVGCYNDRRESRDINDKDFSYLTKLNKTLPTVEFCVQLCAQDGYKIAAVQAL